MTAGDGMLPYLYDEEYSVIILGVNDVSPGTCVVSGHDRKPEWDNQKAKGSTGASSKLNDKRPLAVFTVTFYLTADSFDGQENDFDRWERFQRLIASTTGGPEPFALPIYHPDLARQEITEVTNAGIGGMVHDGLGGASVTVTFQEFRPPKPAATKKATAKGASGTAGKGANATKPDPNAKAKAELAALLAEAKRA
jgi:hypothetical protein